jgi:UDP-N-acetylglucosamine 2-epimerase (non-hydrolysing)
VKLKNILFIFGTRPEAIKLAPLLHELKKFKKRYNVKVCVTGQHNEMLNVVLDFFNIIPDYNLALMEPDQTLFTVTSKCIRGLETVLEQSTPDIIFVQGDTTSAFLGALAGYYKRIKLAHVEAGLRSHNKYSPFPEEINRVLTDHIADYHLAPTKLAEENLAKEGINENVWVVGNTVIDALFLTLKIINENIKIQKEIKAYFNRTIANWKKIENNKIIMVTAHRRESFGQPFNNICGALREIAENFPDVDIIYPVHLNPNVQKPVYEILKGIKNVHLIDPLDYPKTIWLMQKSYVILTDSGGIQEEAPSLGKPVLVMRSVTERVEGIETGTARLVGSDQQKIVRETARLLTQPKSYEKMSKANNPYGDGKSSSRIVKLLGSL